MKHNIKKKASYYIILNGELFKRDFQTPLLKCLNSQLAYYVMQELHKGIYGLHTGGSSLTQLELSLAFCHGGMDILRPLPKGLKQGHWKKF
ncbi:hypothetical protein JHK82_052791 [Glycine max]|uniref:Uncharacterized protein n=1 Tax=Glycine max TaxID=3847 RepID=A0A0R0ETP0_SOYBN|nr:hypothetical protein JHK86_052644 [Glycine max]KAG4915168.1 hypothetical protein JHK87_052725 [Glycine soja]KAG4927009.1 hypothetical protein JHK85_053495 [Glycine max]KAG5082635.1 hypothetical protein JHK84_052673 [Glycine max]KAG5085394.1 hypothetical protein JHK82_052791 [Glycine max]